jgi:hypothetical protein
MVVTLRAKGHGNLELPESALRHVLYEKTDS